MLTNTELVARLLSTQHLSPHPVAPEKFSILCCKSFIPFHASISMAKATAEKEKKRSESKERAELSCFHSSSNNKQSKKIERNRERVKVTRVTRRSRTKRKWLSKMSE